MNLLDRPISWLYTRKIWGSRCSAYEAGCACCRGWALHDWLFNDLAHPDDRAEAEGAGDGR